MLETPTEVPGLGMQGQAMDNQQDTSENQPLQSVISSGQELLHSEQEPANGISTSVLQKKVTSGNDALDILFDAAVQERRGLPTPSTITSIATTPTDDSEDAVLKTWEGCRFVKGGWFTAKDAVLLMDLSVAWFYRVYTTTILTTHLDSSKTWPQHLPFCRISSLPITPTTG